MSTSTVSPRVINLGTPEWCWSHLTKESQGRLSYKSPRGRINLIVLYTVIDQQVVIPLPTFNEVGWFAAGGNVILEVTGANQVGGRWVVRAAATAVRTSPHDLGPSYSRAMHPSNGPGFQQLQTDSLLLTSMTVRGFCEAAAR